MNEKPVRPVEAAAAEAEAAKENRLVLLGVIGAFLLVGLIIAVTAYIGDGFD